MRLCLKVLKVSKYYLILSGAHRYEIIQHLLIYMTFEVVVSSKKY